MKKVRVIKEMPNYPIGSIALRNSDRDTILGICIADLIRDGWLEEVEEPESLLCKLMSTKTFLKTESAQELAHIAMTHAVEVAIKANKTWNGNDGTDIGEYIINALKKEAEGI